MPLYEYRCKECGYQRQSQKRDSQLGYCPDCDRGILKRSWGFQMAPVVHQYFDHSTGQVINDRKHLLSVAKEMSDRQTERTGITHNYVPADMTDKATLGITGEGLDSTYNAQVKSGQIEKGSKPAWQV